MINLLVFDTIIRPQQIIKHTIKPGKTGNKFSIIFGTKLFRLCLFVPHKGSVYLNANKKHATPPKLDPKAP